MTRYAVTLQSQWVRPEDAGVERYLRAGMGDGYYLTIAPGQRILELYHVDDPTTVVDSITLDALNYLRFTARNNAGDVWLLRRGSSNSEVIVSRISQTGGVLTLSDSGTVATDSSPGGMTLLSADDSELVYQQGFPRRTIGIDTSDASINYDKAWTGSGHSFFAHVTPAPGKVFGYCTDHLEYELWDMVGDTLLDAITNPYSYTDDLYAGQSLGLDRFFWSWSSDFAGGRDIQVFDTSADTLAYVWGPTAVDFDWDTDMGALTEATGDLISMAPDSYLASTPPAASLYVIDGATGHVSRSSPSTLVGQGASSGATVGAVWVSSSVCVLGSEWADDNHWSAWSATPVIPPRRRPSLRQRQTFIR